MATHQAGRLMTALLMQLILVSLRLCILKFRERDLPAPGPLHLLASLPPLSGEGTGFERSFLVTLPP